jgi:hypothetical protein
VTGLEEHNPYAVPEAELQVQSVQSQPAAFHPMSPLKAAVMTVLTFGFYDLVFWYRHWARLKESGHDVSPVIRAIFAGFTSFSFVTILSTARAGRGLENGFDLRAAPGIYLALNIASRLSDKILDGIPGLVFTLFTCVGGGWVLATIQQEANEVLKADNYQGPFYSGVTVGTIISGVLGLAFWIFVVLGTVSPDMLGSE